MDRDLPTKFGLDPCSGFQETWVYRQTVLKTIYKKYFLKYQANARFPYCVRPPGMDFLAIFTPKNSHNSGENGRIGKKFKLVLKTIYKKVFLKYQANARFPSLCLPSGNAIFGSGRRKRKRRGQKTYKPIRGSRQGMGCPSYQFWSYDMPWKISCYVPPFDPTCKTSCYNTCIFAAVC